jgi:hypothetical protein
MHDQKPGMGDGGAAGTRVVAWLALGCWLAAWFLPVIDGYSGWSAFIAALQGPFREQFPTSGADAIAQCLSALTNVGFVALFLAWYDARLTRPWMYLKLAVLCLLPNLYWLVEMLRAGERNGLLIGYYVWLAAFALLVALGVIRVVSARRTSKIPRDGTPA